MAEDKHFEPEDHHGPEGSTDADDADEGRPLLGIADLVREIAMTGIATVFMTEDTIRSYFKELRLPKEMMSLVLDGIHRKKDDVYGLVANEVHKMFEKFELSSEIAKFLSSHQIQVQAKIQFTPKEDMARKTTERQSGEQG